jgi:hypothetical protein
VKFAPLGLSSPRQLKPALAALLTAQAAATMELANSFAVVVSISGSWTIPKSSASLPAQLATNLTSRLSSVLSALRVHGTIQLLKHALHALLLAQIALLTLTRSQWSVPRANQVMWWT